MEVEEIRMEIDRIEERQASLKLLVIQCEQKRQEYDGSLKLLRQQLSHAVASRDIDRELTSPMSGDAVEHLIDQLQLESPEKPLLKEANNGTG